jgi:predicted NUDIX family phosphoesterase
MYSREFYWVRSEARREIDEQISYHASFPMHPMIGFINDDSNQLGRTHIIFVYRFVVPNADVQAKDDCLPDSGMVQAKNLIENRELYENLSKVIIDKVIRSK